MGGIEVNSNVLPGAEVSPRVANGCLCWYEGDTFELGIQLDVTDQDGEAVVLAPDDRVRVTFWDERRGFVQEFLFTDIQDNTVTLAFTEDISALFPEGNYSYDLRLEHGKQTTLMRRNLVHVD